MLDYHIDIARNIVITRANGRVTVPDVTSYFVRLMRAPDFKPELNALIVVGDLSSIPGPVGVGALTPLIRAWSKRRAGVKWAFVLPNKSSRDFIEGAIDQARLTALTARAFLSEATALAWLEPASGATLPTAERAPASG